MAICMKLSPHVCEAACDAPGVRRGRTTTVIGIRVPDEWARKIKELAGKSGEGTVNDYLRHVIRTQVLRKR